MNDFEQVLREKADVVIEGLERVGPLSMPEILAVRDWYDQNRRGEPCEAVIWHGPGHQSRSKCELTGEHKVHEYHRGNERLRWAEDEGMTGYFDESPLDDE